MWFPMFLQLKEELSTLGFLMQLTKCVVWSLHGLDHFISFPLSFIIPNLAFCILGALVGSTPFVESFMVEDFRTISNLPMLVDL
jgi:hypothetical protein